MKAAAVAVVRSVAVSAAKGQPRSQKLFIDMVDKTEAAIRLEHERSAEAVADYHRFWDEVFHEHRVKGLPLPNPAPHPDDVRFDPATGRIIFTGPTSEDAKIRWEELSDRLQSLERSIAELKALRDDPENTDIAHLIDDDIAFETKLSGRIRDVLKGWRKRS